MSSMGRSVCERRTSHQEEDIEEPDEVSRDFHRFYSGFKAHCNSNACD